MISVRYEADDDRFISLEVSGHADFGEYGKDLICASVSSIMFGFLNALDELSEDVEIEQKENSIRVANGSDSKVVNDYLKLVLMQLKTIEVSYGDFIKVERK